ncbi:crotonase/enoyl-CoA hydratase family protein [Minwuia thermotolerans]|jgi:enoyl-CoA hydratase/carnithine racemase|uniref:Enoyl-CoA hydratase n=1 Tax=Minwuia thermotolerans TaxID=2056226 RepID=A0A2M9FZP1_9PROT|nr:crotonase/enoyl-CoA hydratase family protein [Minwuia thermotolerans]ANK82717.1 MAG: enoyl-CoA hydratase [Rhizobiales bacterium NRL2]PJK28915.1 enoyl-CoA hydratase [Minwuia thermotolerans]
MDYEHIIYAVEDGILTITLNRPDKLNAFTEQMRTEIMDALDKADADDDVRAIIFTGAGRGYCAGADLSRGGSTFDYSKRGYAEGEVVRDGGGVMTLRIYQCKKPVIGAINGPAVGVGSTMQLPMDIRIASEKARFGFVFAQRGVVPEACSSYFLPRLVGISQALDWAYSGRVFEADEALKGGLVKEVVPHDQLLPRAREIAKSYMERSSAVSVAMIRAMFWRLLAADHPMEAHQIDSRGMVAMGAAADAQEGVSSFLEKRAPNFTMKPSQDMPDFYPWWEEPEFK